MATAHSKQAHNLFKHGLYYHPGYRIYCRMRAYCYDKKSGQYENYGGRGIYVCAEWRGHLEAFCAWVDHQFPTGKIPPGLQIDRKDNDGPYSPENCRFVTHQEQQNNKRDNRPITFDGRTQNLAQWAREKGMSKHCLYIRLKHGWSVERAITTPVYHNSTWVHKNRTLS